jgi:patatin-like phospholipase/acyl hydrolase
MIVGTSTGALIALALTRPVSIPFIGFLGDNLDEHDVLPTQIVTKIYTADSKEIFKKSVLQDIKSGFNLWGPKYDRSSYDKFLSETFGDTLFKDTKCKVVIPSYDLMRNKRIICKSWENFQKSTMKDIAGGATAAPTYFSPVNIQEFYLNRDVISGTTYNYSLIDGGIWANNPELIGVYEALALNPELKKENIYILSLGTGDVQLKSDASKLQNAGIIDWLKSGLINMMMETESEWTATAIKEIYPNMVRIEPYLPSTLGAFDDASDENLEGLLKIAERYIENNPNEIKGIVESLT